MAREALSSPARSGSNAWYCLFPLEYLPFQETVRQGPARALLPGCRLAALQPVCCRSAAHQDRARQKILPHLTAYAVNDFKRWANKQLSLKGAKLEIVPPAKSFSPPSI